MMNNPKLSSFTIYVHAYFDRCQLKRIETDILYMYKYMELYKYMKSFILYVIYYSIGYEICVLINFPSITVI